MLKRLLPDPFVLVLIGTVLFASFLPARGVASQAVSLMATIAVALLFFFHGAKLARSQIIEGMIHWRLHLVILSATFALFPLLWFGLHAIAGNLLPSPLWTGLLFLCLLPSTVQSSIAFTSMARGNVPAAIAAASASQILGVFLTPFLTTALIGARGDAAMSPASLGSIFALILVPFLAGHFLRPWIGAWVTRHKASISLSDRSAILLSVYSAFSAAVVEGLWNRVSVETLGIVTGLCLLLFLVTLGITWSVGRLLKFSVEDRIVLMFCGTKKSLVQGVPMARVLFSGPELGLVLLPVMIFHQLQLMICAGLARHFSRRD